MILIISASWDQHATKVKDFINKLGIECLVFNTDQYSKSNYLKFIQNKFSLVIDNRLIDIKSITSLWVRQPFLWYFIDKNRSEKEYLFFEYRKVEVFDLIKSFITYCENTSIFTINNIGRKLENKITNLMAAKDLGFTTPETVVGNNVDDFKLLAKKFKSLVIKPFTGVAFFGKKYIGNDLVEIKSSKLLENINKLDTYYPLQIQEKIVKKFDIRITTVGKNIFPCAIHSQENPASKLDFRIVDSKKIHHESYQLPKKIEDLCFKLCRKFKMNYSTIDMALDINNRYVYFEVNPDGEYLWIEDMTDLKISQAIAELLINPRVHKLV